MARLPALVKAVADNDRRPLSLITHFARMLRADEPMIVSDKAGLGAQHMDVKDAVTLLMAVTGAYNPAGAREAVSNLRTLIPRPWDSFDEDGAELRQDGDLEFLHTRASFAETLGLMITNAHRLAAFELDYQKAWDDEKGDPNSAEGFSMERMVRKLDPKTDPYRPSYARIVRVVVYAPGLAAEIHCGRPWKQFDEGGTFHEFYAPPPTVEKATERDVLGTIEFGVPTLLAMNALVAPEPTAPYRVESP